jgi:hypothetical protein
LLGCTQDFSIFEPDGGTPADGSTSDSASDSAAPDAGGGDGGLTFQCGGGTVSSCSQCNGMPQACVYCRFNDPAVQTGTCVTMGSSCSNGIPAGFARCACATASACPENDQVCRMGTCRTCSESQFNNGSACTGGGTCNSADGGCN